MGLLISMIVSFGYFFCVVYSLVALSDHNPGGVECHHMLAYTAQILRSSDAGPVLSSRAARPLLTVGNFAMLEVLASTETSTYTC